MAKAWARCLLRISVFGHSANASHNAVLRLVTDREFAIRAVRYALHLPTPKQTEDRRVLEQVIFPYYIGRSDMRTVLFVGCAWYTRHYGKAFFGNHDYWTMDPSVGRRQSGNGRQHVVGHWERLDAHFPEGYFDLIIANGVYGFGLDTSEQCEAAFAHSYSRLREGGHFVLGWNDVPERAPVPLAEITSLRRFTRWTFPAFSTWRYATDTPHRHVFDFYLKESHQLR